MNYVSAVYGVVVSIIAIDWLSRGRKEYRGQTDRREDVEETVRRVSIASHLHGVSPGLETGRASVGSADRSLK
jgi:hypothetical protein